MNNINVRILATANVTQSARAFGTLEAQVAGLNSQLSQMVALQNGVDGQGFQRLSRAAEMNASAFRNAVDSTSMFERQQLRVNKATDDYTEKLRRQKLSFRDLLRQRKVAAAAYKEQIAMENMVVRRGAMSNAKGKQTLDVMYPRQVSEELNTAGRRMAWFNEQVKSGAHQMVNWGKNTQWAGRQLMVGITMPMVAAGAAAGVLAYKMDQEFTRIQKVYDTTADVNSASVEQQKAAERELMQLREAGTKTAIDAARNYGAAATDTLNVQAELAATGIRGAELQKSTTQVMRIARLGELDYQDALGATISLQTVFRQNTDQLAESFNYMNSIENATSLTTQDFAAAIPIAAAPIKAFGGDIKELGVLLTAMKSRGIQATQGANAIKAAMQRLGRPSRQIREEWQALTNTNITEIVEDSNSLTEIFQKINAATKNLNMADRRKAFAGLFGTYQVTRMNALVEGIADIETGYGQVGRAAEIAGQDSAKWASDAQREIDRLNESVSGKFKNALEETKIQMSTLGEPFVEVATVALNGVSKIIEIFNGLPSGVKKLVAVGVAVAAIAGPVIMLGGLFANLFGNFLSGGAAVMSLFAKMNILSTGERAAALATQWASSEFVSQRTAVQQLTMELNKLIAAQAEANAMTATGAAATQRNAASTAMAAGAVATQTARTAYANAPVAVGAGAIGPLAAPSGYFKDYYGAKVVNPQAVAQLDSEYAAMKKMNREQAIMNTAVAKEAATREVTHKAAWGTAAATAAMAAGMALTLTNSNEVANSIGNWLVISSMVVPAVTMLGPLLKDGAGKALTIGSNMKTAATEAFRAQGGAKGLAGGLKAGLMAVGGMMGPVGWIATAVAAVGVGIFAWRKHVQEAKEEQTRLNQSVNKMGDTWAAAAGKAKKEWAGLTLEVGKAREATRDQELYEQYNTGDMKKIIKDYNSEAFSGADRERFLRQHFMELQAEYGLTAQEAAANIRALLSAAGMGLEEARAKAEELYRTFGDIGQQNIGSYLKNQIDIMNNTEINTKQWDTAAKDAADVFVKGFNDDMSNETKQELLAEVARGGLAGWEGVINEWSGGATFKQLGIKSVKDLRAAISDSGGIDEFLNDQLANGMPVSVFARLQESLKAAETAERSFFGKINSSNSELGLALDENVDTLDEFMRSWIVMGANLTLPEAQEAVRGLGKELTTTSGFAAGLLNTAEAFGAEVPEVDKLRQVFANMDPDKAQEFSTAIATIARMQGIQQGKDAVQTYLNILNGVKIKTDQVTAATRNWTTALGDLDSAQANEMAKGAMQQTQQDIADAINDNFDERMNASLDARQKMWDSRSAALDAQIQRRQQAMQDQAERETLALDAKWERKKDAAENYWERRIARINQAIEAEQKAEAKRQKMFDNEMARIKRLNDAMNTNIDFNVALNEGKFDEAAKIRNDMSATAAQTALERAAESGAGASDRRVNRMQGRLDRVEGARDADMKRLDKREKAEKRHLQKMQTMRERAFDRTTKAQQNSLRKQTENDMTAQRRIWENRKKALQKQVELFLAYTAKNEKDLRRHMRTVGLAYDDFGSKLMKRGDKWSKHFGDRFRYHLRVAGMEMASDAMWEKLGRRSSREVLKGMGFVGGMKDFRKFLRTGEIPEPKPSGLNNQGAGAGTTSPKIRHEGGWIGDGKDSRKGVARTQRGLGPGESMVLARKKEFMVNERAAAANADYLTAINNSNKRINPASPYGNDGQGEKYGTGGPGPGMGLAGMVAGMANRGLTHGVGKAMAKAYKAKKQAASSFDAGVAGTYGDTAFGIEQLRNAAIIASVGSKMKMSARDIQIGIMTAIAESMLRNVNYGDRDSLGLFQQRPSMGWGTPEQVRNPQYAARKFFNSLKGVGNRDAMSPWMAAQTVQRSAFSDGSNYRKYWDEAQSIFSRGLNKTKTGFAANTGFIDGAGGRHRPMKSGVLTQGIHYNNALDLGVKTGTPVYSVADGKVTGSYDIRGFEPRAKHGGLGYKSYGRVIKINHGGFDTLYAHLSERFARAGQKVRGGAKIGLSGNTGNSSGPHLHFEAHGANPFSFWNLKSGRGGTGGPGRKGKKYGKFTYPSAVMGAVDMPSNRFSTTNLSGNYVGKRYGNNAANAAGSLTEGVFKPTGKKNSFRAGTYNVYQGANHARSAQDIKRLTQASDILSLQEYRPARARKVNPMLAKLGWGIFGQNSSGTAIAWNKRVLQLMKSGIESLGKGTIRGMGGERKFSPYGLFKVRNGGKKFWQVSAHTIAKPHRGRAQTQRRLQQFEALRKLQMRLGKTAPVVMGGDFNSGYAKMGDDKVLSKIGLAGARYKGTSTMDDRRVYHDQVLQKGVRRVSDYRVYQKGMASDHNAVVSSYQIPGLKVGGEIKWDNTIANLHKDEKVLTAPLSKKLDQGINNFANGAGNTYNVNMVVNESNDGKALFRQFKAQMAREEARKPGSRRG